MAALSYLKSILPVAVAVLIVMCFLGSFFAQTPTPSPSPLASPAVSPSPSPTSTPSPTPTPLPGAQNFHQWGSITVFNGLPSDSVRAIAQTPDGVMWFGTDNGLVRFDGRRIQTMAIGDGEVDRIVSLKVSRTGQLWIGTRAGAFVYSDNNFKPVQNTEKSAITAIYFGTGTYLATETGDVLPVLFDTGGGITAYQSSALSVTASEGVPTAVTSLVEQDGVVFAATSGRGIFSVKGGGLNAVHAPPSPGVVNALAIGDGLLWLGTDAPKGTSGIYRSTGGQRFERVAAPTSKVLSLESNDAGIWAGTERYGLFHFADSKLKKNYTFANTSGGLRSDTIYTLFTDREGVLWIGTNRGVSRFDQQGSFQQTVSDIPNSNFVRTLWFNGRALYAGSNRGLFEYDYESEAWDKVPGLEDRVIYDIGVNAQGIVVGTASGTYDFHGRSIIGGDTRSVESFGKATYAAIVGRGVVDISTSRQEVVFPDETVSALLTVNGILWIGTGGNGLFSFDGKTTKPEVGPEELKAGTVWNMSPGLDGSIWIAGQHGVFRVLNEQVEKVIEAEEVRDVYVDGKDVWAATTTRGLLHARRAERFGWLVSAVGFEQGLPSEKAFSILPAAEGLLIATNRGVVTYRRSDLPPKLIATRILSQRVHDLIELKSAIALEYPQNSLLVEVAGQSSRTFPEEFQYAFVLTNAKGEELARQISSDPQYAPKDLKPGKYTIEAVAFNRDLLASDPLFLSFSVAKAPFPWTATALGVLLVLALVGLLWAFIEHRRMTHRNRELAAARFDLANEAERERRRIARDLHDQTLADLRNLMMKSDKGTLSGPEFREEVEAVSTEIRRICEDLSPSVLENVGLVASLEFLLGQTIENHRFSADETVEEKIRFPVNVQLQIYRIAQEVLANIQRHSDANLVEMTVGASEEGELLLQIIDDGKPFHPDGGTKPGRGIANIRSRASLINAELDWKSWTPGKNVFELRVADKSE
ncbi:MAG: hypothetical protein KIT61_06220 [Pyrinomonadaceae bacterium]|nr:hypothetical protein [Pyrinomonadaceae bacterium]